MMAEEMFKPYTNHLPSGVASQYDKDEVLVLDGSLQDVAAKGWHFLDFAKFLEDRVVFLTPESAVVAYSNSPSHHLYAIDMLCLRGPSQQKKKTLHISSVNPEGSTSTLSSLFALFVSSNKDKECNEVVFKCFATNQQKPFEGVDLSGVLPAVLDRSTCKVSLSFQFMSISPSQCHNILACEVLCSVEFRQCTVEGLAQVLRECKPAGQGPQKLKISCSQQEFANFAEGVCDNKLLRELDLLLHFIFSDQDKKRLIFCLQDTGIFEHGQRWLERALQGTGNSFKFKSHQLGIYRQVC